MKAKHELDRPENVIETKASIYYVVKGRKKSKNTEDAEYYEEFFVDDNPIEARKKAFSYYQNYLTILQENNLLSKREFSESFEFLNTDSDFESLELQVLGGMLVRYFNPSSFDKGVALYMVVKDPIDYMNKKDIKNDRFLIHGVFNFEDVDMREMIEGVIREYGYYSKGRYDKSGYEEQINFSNYAMGFGLYSMITTPYNWFANHYLDGKNKINKTAYRMKYLKEAVTKGSLDKYAFETRLSKHKLTKIMASFLNSKGGTLFYGIDEINRCPEDVFKKIKPDFFKKEMKAVLKTQFGLISKQITIQFIKVNSKYVALFKVQSKGEECIFINENNTKKFFIRSKEGIEQIKDQNLLIDYCVNRKSKDKTIDDILDMI